MSSDPSQPSQETEVPQESQESAPEASPEQDPSQESPDADAAAPESEGDEGDGEEAPEEQPAAAQPDKGHRRSGGFQRKIDRLERQLEQALALANQNARGGQPQQPAAPEAPKTDAERAALEFQAMVDQRVQQRMAQQEEQSRQQRLHADLQRQMAEARVKHADFDDALQDVAHIPVPPHVHEAILTSDTKAEIMYSLAKNPAELARISALPPLVAAREIGRLEAKFASGAAPQTPKPAVRPPVPPSKVGGQPASTRNLDDLPLSEYKRAHRSGRR